MENLRFDLLGCDIVYKPTSAKILVGIVPLLSLLIKYLTTKRLRTN